MATALLTPPNEELILQNAGLVSLSDVKNTLGDIFSEMSSGKKLKVEFYKSDFETLFVFQANNICATLCIQRMPEPKKKGGK